ncbi:MAG TPA: WecB/TagA/CpsF family glycosyltransferase [Bacteroidales bacterium]|nr:WecB/TagA/CpsF family glycosyltransferase [Bacteroidales bacterium]
MVNNIELLNFQININIPDFNYNEQTIINTINPHSYCISKKDILFNEALHQSDILIPDGIGIVYAARILKKIKIKRISGSDIHQFLIEKANKNNLKIFYLGASQETLEKIEFRIKKEFPSITVKYYSPPYKEEFSDYENSIIIEEINNFEPQILFIGMTAPKQEKWVNKNKVKLKNCIICSIGAVFDFYAGTINRPNKIWQRLGLEWFMRFIKEPKRLWRRNFISTPCFLWDVIKEKIRNSN